MGCRFGPEALSTVTFHNKLGSEQARIDRIAVLARYLAPVAAADADMAEQAARAAKADLSSEMVYEFPELQGVMGRYYATAAGLPASVAEACEAHYAPLGPSDQVPTAPVAVAVALADKLDKLTGFWAINEKPTGSKDPFALRRAALGVIRLLLENRLSCGLMTVFAQGYDGADADDLLGFFHDRLKVYLRDQGIRHDVIDACTAMAGNDDLTLLSTRAAAVSDFIKTNDGENLLQAFKRANNILDQAEAKDGVEYSYGADVKYAEAEVERALFAALDAKAGTIEAAVLAEDFVAALSGMAELRKPLDDFFEAVQINDENAVIRRNRLNLLSPYSGDLPVCCRFHQGRGITDPALTTGMVGTLYAFACLSACRGYAAPVTNRCGSAAKRSKYHAYNRHSAVVGSHSWRSCEMPAAFDQA
jgi:glycyl-tRNA synthetase beta chain